MSIQFVGVQCNTLTSLLCPHSHFLSKVSYSKLVCCSHRHIVARVVQQTRSVIGQFHPSRNSDWFIEHVIHIIRSVQSSVLHLVSSQAVVMGWKEDSGGSKVSMQWNLIIGIMYTHAQIVVEDWHGVHSTFIFSGTVWITHNRAIASHSACPHQSQTKTCPTRRLGWIMWCGRTFISDLVTLSVFMPFLRSSTARGSTFFSLTTQCKAHREHFWGVPEALFPSGISASSQR